MQVHDCIFFQLAKAGQAGAGFWAGKVAHLGVTASQAVVLNFLGEEDCIPARNLGQRVRITSATMTGILDRLEKMALIKRRPHPDDRRAIQVCLTGQGRRCAEEINSLMVAANREVLAQMAPGNAELFRDLLRQVQAATQPYAS